MRRASPRIPDLSSQLWRLIQQIPRGRISTIRELALALGDIKACRFIADELHNHAHCATCRCHRVLRTDLSPGRYVAGRDDEKRSRLRVEQVSIDSTGKYLAAFAFREFDSKYPLRRLAEWQQRLARRQLAELRECPQPETIGGVDVAYPSPNLAQAALVVIERKSGVILRSETARKADPFPYIPGYLTFRELPVIRRVLRKAARAGIVPDALMVDGSGILHPRRLGLACVVGWLSQIPTIGVTKTHLCGTWQAPTKRGAASGVLCDGSWLGSVILPRSKSRRPIFVSPGYGCTVEQAEALVREMLTTRCRLPIPIHCADTTCRSR